MNASAVKRLSGKRMNMSDSAIRELNRMETAGGENGEQPEKIAVIDFKMVTFSLAGKDYAIDIMNVKEIAKAGRFTYVPNTAPFVLGVYNLRGDIIPIIDLRLFFNIPTSKREDDALESLIFIHVDEQTFGIVVDEIDKVVGISRNTIQPPHPIFGDINIKYIHGVVENQGRLYILLDVERIFSARVREEEAEALPEMEVTRAPLPDKKTSRAELDISFIRDGLAALAKFHVTAVNERWVSERYREWRSLRKDEDTQLASSADAEQYLETFFSPDTGRLWGDQLMDAFIASLPDNQAKQIHVWNVGCGKGYESYSLAVALRERYPASRIRIYANDSDLLSISNAPMLSVPDVPETSRYRKHMVQGVNGSWAFSEAVREMVLFEYHDCNNQNNVPNMDIIVSRDVLSFLNPKQQMTLIQDFSEKLKDNGTVYLGQNEAMPQQSGWLRHVNGQIISFSKE